MTEPWLGGRGSAGDQRLPAGRLRGVPHLLQLRPSGDVQLGTYTYLDLTPLGRQEDWEQPAGRSDGPFMSWVRRHDEYEA